MRLFYILVLSLAACGGGDDPNEPGETCTATDTVSVDDFEFSPACIRVQTGTQVTFTNDGAEAHTVTSDPGSLQTFDSGNLDPGFTFGFTFTTPGDNSGHCEYHPSMTFEVRVEQ